MPEYDVIVGVDPGLKGGVAAVCGDRVIFARPMPLAELDERRSRVCGPTFSAWVDEACEAVGSERVAVYIENAWGRSGDGAGGAFSFGAAFIVPFDRGAELGDVRLINPKKWQHALLGPFYSFGEDDDIRTPRQRSKLASISRALHVHPRINLRPGRCRVDQDGIADALNIADYGWLENTGRLEEAGRKGRKPAPKKRRNGRNPNRNGA